MFHFFKKLLPLSWRNQFRRILKDGAETNTQNERIAILEQQVQHLTQHINNVADLTVSTTKNLESVGKALESVDQNTQQKFDEINTHSKALESTQSFLLEKQEELNKNVIQLSHENAKTQMCNILYFQNLPEMYPITVETRKFLEEFKTGFKVDFPFFEGIAKNDIMFLYSLLHIGDFPKSYHSYLSTGLNGFNLIQRILVSARESSTMNGKILDFASGYGRVTRFLAGYYAPEKIYTSDIKPEAVDFQTRHMKVKGFYSDYDPFKIQVIEKFEVIFVGSLFSHLNKELYKKWLLQLISLTEEKGLLIFTVHDMSLYPGDSNEDHIYVEDNEDAPFGFVEDQITSKEKYGTSFATEKFIKDLLYELNPNLQYVRYPRGFGGLQDVYVVSKTGPLPKPDLDLSVYP